MVSCSRIALLVAALGPSMLSLLAPNSQAAGAKPACPSKAVIQSVLGAKVSRAHGASLGVSASTTSTPSMKYSVTCPYGPVEIGFSVEAPTAKALGDIESEVKEDFAGVKTVSGLGGGAFSVSLAGGAPYLYVLDSGKGIFEIEGSKSILNATNELALAKKLLALKTL